MDKARTTIHSYFTPIQRRVTLLYSRKWLNNRALQIKIQHLNLAYQIEIMIILSMGFCNLIL